VNPVIPESVAMACARVMGNHLTVTIAGQSGQLELNAALPVLAVSLLESVTLLTASAKGLRERCIDGLEADEERCRSLVERSLAQATALAPVIGYDKAAEIAKKAHEAGRTVREVAEAMAILPPKQLKALLDPARMTEPGFPAGSAPGETADAAGEQDAP
jgi:fumarate hydratase class II